MGDRRIPTGPATHSAASSTEATSRARRAVVASSVGNALEWFDIIVYSSFAVVISALFFPKMSGFAALMLTFLTFAVSYLIRPIGAAVIGSYADRAGRKNALSFTILAMMVGTGLMALAPTAAAIGPVAAGIWLLVSRLVQGFSAGGSSAPQPPIWWRARPTAGVSTAAGRSPPKVRRCCSPHCSGIC